MNDFERIKEKFFDKIVYFVILLLSTLVLVIAKALPSTLWEQLDNNIPKPALWAALGILVEIGILIAAYIIHLHKEIKKSKTEYHIPTKTITVVRRHQPEDYQWSMGSRADKPCMNVSATFIVTNITDFDILLSGAKIKKPKTMGYVSVESEQGNRRLWGWYNIASKQSTRAEVEFWITPPFKKEGESFSTDIAILDQFGNEHWEKNITFSYRQ